MSILNRYIRNSIISSTCIVLLVVMGIESFMEFVDQLSSIGEGHYGVLQALMYVPMQLPGDLYQLFPMIGFLGSLIGLGRLASSSELVVMRSAGISIAQIAWSVVKAALIMIVVVTVIGEWVSPMLQLHAEQLREKAMGKNVGISAIGGAWLRKANAFVHVGKVVSATQIQNVTRFHFLADDQLQSIYVAKRGELKNGHWHLYDINETRFTKKGLQTLHPKEQTLDILFQPKLLQNAEVEADRESISTLLKSIVYREKSGLMTAQYEFAFWQRIIQPITTIVMICLGIPFIFGSLRSASTGLRVMTGVVIGFGFYMLNQFFGPITMVYQFPPILSALTPTVLFLLAYAILLRRIKT